MTSCLADRRFTYDHAAAVASHRAELALPVRVADAPPLELIQIPPVAVAPVAETAEARFEAEPELRATTRGRPHLAQRASVVRKKNTNGKEFLLAQVRTPAGRRIYLGVCQSKEEGIAICRRYMATGVRPPKQATGPKAGSKKRQQPEPFGSQPATETHRKPVAATLRPKRPVDIGEAASGARIASEQVALEAKARRLEMLKQIWRAGA